MESSLYSDAYRYDLVHPALWKGELEFYLRQAGRCDVQPPAVLELACGTGRLCVPLAQRSLRLTGLDLSASMLEAARARSAAADVQIAWVQADMRNFQLGQQFDLIFIPINSVCHLLSREDFENCLACARTHLAPGGLFIVDVFVPDLKILSRPADRWYDLGAYSGPGGEQVHLSEQNRYDPATQVNTVTWRFEDGGGRVDHTLHMRMYFPQELEALLAYNGLPAYARYGKYNENPFHSESARHITVSKAA